MNVDELLEHYTAGEIDFSGVNLRGANLFAADLISIILIHADLHGANLTFAYLNRAQLYPFEKLFSPIALGVAEKLFRCRIFSYLP